MSPWAELGLIACFLGWGGLHFAWGYERGKAEAYRRIEQMLAHPSWTVPGSETTVYYPTRQE